MSQSDRDVIRDLARRYTEVSSDPVNDRRRDLWRRHNALQKTPPLIYVRAFAWQEMPESRCVCEDPFLRQFERFFRTELFRYTFQDDFIFESWVTLQATRKCTGWGVSPRRIRSDDPRGSFKVDYPIRQLEDMEKLREPWHEIDEEKTGQDADRLHDAIGDLIDINVDRAPAHRTWSADLSTDLGYLRGIEHFMMDMLDNPEWFHRLLEFMSRGVLSTHEQAETAGDWGLGAHQNQAMAYEASCQDPAPNVNGVNRKALWTFVAAQEYAVVSPAMHEEFLLRYQLPIMSEFGLASYGCCEDLTDKIDMLRQVPNLRRIAVAPAADVARCAEQIEQDYVISYRPSPTDMVGYGFDRDRITGILRKDLEACRDCHVDVTLKDVETVEGDPSRVKRWVEITRKIIDEVFN